MARCILDHCPKIYILQSFIFLFYLCFTLAYEVEYDHSDVELTTTVAPGKVDCFFQFAKVPEVLQFEYRVTDATFGELDMKKDMRINFNVKSPMGDIIFSHERKMEGAFKHEVKENGDYKICLDNSFSHFSSKTVYFEVYVDISSDKYHLNNLNVLDHDLASNNSLDYLKETVNKVKDGLNRVKHFQDTFRAVEARDINIQEKNFTKVNTFSSLTTVAMMLFGAFHLFALKSLFIENSKLYKLLRNF